MCLGYYIVVDKNCMQANAKLSAPTQLIVYFQGEEGMIYAVFVTALHVYTYTSGETSS